VVLLTEPKDIRLLEVTNHVAGCGPAMTLSRVVSLGSNVRDGRLHRYGYGDLRPDAWVMSAPPYAETIVSLR
jgi:hypothetical protein